LPISAIVNKNQFRLPYTTTIQIYTVIQGQNDNVCISLNGQLHLCNGGTNTRWSEHSL